MRLFRTMICLLLGMRKIMLLSMFCFEVSFAERRSLTLPPYCSLTFLYVGVCDAVGNNSVSRWHDKTSVNEVKALNCVFLQKNTTDRKSIFASGHYIC